MQRMALPLGFLVSVCCLSVQAADSLPSLPLQIMLLDVASGEYRPVAPKSGFHRQGSPTFSPDEKFVAFDARHRGERFSETRIVVKSLANPDEPAVDMGSGAMPSYSKNGEEIAFSRPGQGVWIMDSDGRGEVQISNKAWHIVFSPLDEDVVAYGVRDATGPNIVVHNLLTDEIRNVLSNEVSQIYRQIYWNFQWSSDARFIAFKGIQADESTVLSVVGMERNDSYHRELMEFDGPTRACFHPQTGHVYYAFKPPTKTLNRVFSVDHLAKEDIKTLQIEMPNQQEYRSDQPGDWSSDGKRLLLTSRRVARE